MRGEGAVSIRMRRELYGRLCVIGGRITAPRNLDADSEFEKKRRAFPKTRSNSENRSGRGIYARESNS